MHVKIGDKIYFGKYSGTEVGEDHLIIREEDILGIIE
jgi:chaperonin GroES